MFPEGVSGGWRCHQHLGNDYAIVHCIRIKQLSVSTSLWIDLLKILQGSELALHPIIYPKIEFRIVSSIVTENDTAL